MKLSSISRARNLVIIASVLVVGRLPLATAATETKSTAASKSDKSATSDNSASKTSSTSDKNASADKSNTKSDKTTTSNTKSADSKSATDNKSTNTVTKSSDVTKPKTDAAQINLNTATQQQLEKLTDIGPTRAGKIIARRPYKSIDDLSRAGIPAATITKIRAMVTVTSSPPPQTVAKPVTPDPKPATPDKSSKLVDLNKATEAELQEISGVGEAYSKKIIEGRPYKSIDDLSKAGIPAASIDKIKPQVTVGGPIDAPAKGMVWVNLDTKLYHKESSRWYGKTKSGKYMTEAEAQKAGYKSSKR
jgi:DNA uptake protein ComE-like DNA-binding protein